MKSFHSSAQILARTVQRVFYFIQRVDAAVLVGKPITVDTAMTIAFDTDELAGIGSMLSHLYRHQYLPSNALR